MDNYSSARTPALMDLHSPARDLTALDSMAPMVMVSLDLDLTVLMVLMVLILDLVQTMASLDL